MARTHWRFRSPVCLLWPDPLLVALFALRFDSRERVTGMRLIGLLIGMGGVVTLLGFDVGGDTQSLLGAMFVLLAAVGYAISALLIRRPRIAALPNLAVVTVECITSTIVFVATDTGSTSKQGAESRGDR